MFKIIAKEEFPDADDQIISLIVEIMMREEKVSLLRYRTRLFGTFTPGEVMALKRCDMRAAKFDGRTPDVDE